MNPLLPSFPPGEIEQAATSSFFANALPVASDRFEAANARFWSSESELLSRKQWATPRRSSVGVELDAFISRQHALRQKPQSWHRHPEQPFKQWKEGFLRTLKETLVIPDALGMPSEPVLKQRLDHGEFVEEQIELSLTPSFRSAAIVTIPKNGRTKHPALVLLHSFGSLNLYGKEKFFRRPGEPSYLGECRRKCYEGRSLLAEFAKLGYLCIAIDAFGFGCRTRLAARDLAAFEEKRRTLTREAAETLSLQIAREEYEQSARALGSVGLSIAAITATDDLRTIDYLTTRRDVDPNRIGCAGLSFGSFRANYLAALDDRVRAAASICWISTLDGIVNYNLPFSLGFFALPDNLYRRFDMIDIPIAAAPKPFMAISGWRDILMEPKGTADAHLSLRRAWEAAGSPETLGSLVFDAPHEFNHSMQESVRRFFQQYL